MEAEFQDYEANHKWLDIFNVIVNCLFPLPIVLTY